MGQTFPDGYRESRRRQHHCCQWHAAQPPANSDFSKIFIANEKEWARKNAAAKCETAKPSHSIFARRRKTTTKFSLAAPELKRRLKLEHTRTHTLTRITPFSQCLHFGDAVDAALLLPHIWIFVLWVPICSWVLGITATASHRSIAFWRRHNKHKYCAWHLHHRHVARLVASRSNFRIFTSGFIRSLDLPTTKPIFVHLYCFNGETRARLYLSRARFAIRIHFLVPRSQFSRCSALDFVPLVFARYVSSAQPFLHAHTRAHPTEYIGPAETNTTEPSLHTLQFQIRVIYYWVKYFIIVKVFLLSFFEHFPFLEMFPPLVTRVFFYFWLVFSAPPLAQHLDCIQFTPFDAGRHPKEAKNRTDSSWRKMKKKKNERTKLATSCSSHSD